MTYRDRQRLADIQTAIDAMLPRQPLRFLVADDPGAGKTIMAGLFCKELMIRGDVERCLIIAPGSLLPNGPWFPSSGGGVELLAELKVVAAEDDRLQHLVAGAPQCRRGRGWRGRRVHSDLTEEAPNRAACPWPASPALRAAAERARS